MSKNIDVFRNYFSSLVNQQIAQSQFSNSFGNKNKTNQTSNTATETQASTQNDSLFDNLSQLLNNTQGSTQASNLSNTINQLLQSGASSNSIVSLLTSLVINDDDLLFTRTNGEDLSLNIENNMKYIGGDFKQFLEQAKKVSEVSGDIDGYIESVSSILDKGDYDDLRRFIDVTNDSLIDKDFLPELFEFAQDSAKKYSENIENIFFGFQTLYNYGCDLDTALDVLKHTDKGANGRKNISELTAFLVEIKKMGINPLEVIKQMANAVNTNAFIDEYAKAHGIVKTETQLDYNRFKRIEGVDIKKPVIMRQGESVALFAQAISNTEGVLPPSVLFWSSVQTGAITDGTNYLDLSKLAPGTYDVYVKVGNYPATDTAKRKIRVLGKDENLEDVDLESLEEEDSFDEEEFASELERYNRIDQNFRGMYDDFMKDCHNNDNSVEPMNVAEFATILGKVKDQLDGKSDKSLSDVMENMKKDSEAYRAYLAEFRKYVEIKGQEEYLDKKEAKQEEVLKDKISSEKRQKEEIILANLNYHEEVQLM